MFQDLLIILFISVLSVSFVRKFSLPPILGYLFTGMLVSPNWLGFVQARPELETLSEFGVVFLLFMIGLELSVPKLISMRRSLITLGGGQVLITTLIIIAIGSQIEVLSFAGAIAIAGALTLSSTAVVTKQLVEQSELQSRYGQLILSILLFQDLAAVPFLIIIPSLANSGSGVSISDELYTLIPTGIIVVSALLIIGRVILRPLYNIVAGAKSSELFMLATLLVALSSGAITGAVGLSKELGAFLAGVMLAETQYAHQIETDIQPFRDVLLGLFFVTVGLHLQPYVLVMYFKTIILLLLALILVKTTVIYCLARYIGKHDRATALRAGLSLAQGGEFGFAILAIETSSAILPSNVLNIVTCVVIMSITIAPILIRKGHKIAELLLRKTSKAKPAAIEDIVNAQLPLRDHVIICGYGRTGQSLALFLEQESMQFVGIELNPDRLGEALSAQEPIYYGDATKEETLLGSGLLYAKLIVITFDDAHKARRMLKIIRHNSPSVPVLVRTRDDRYLATLQQSGATEVIPEALEGSLMMASHMLLLLGVPADKVHQKIADIKSYRYQMMRFFYQSPQKSPELTPLILHTVAISEKHWAFGKTAEELKKDNFPVVIHSFTRQGIRSNQEPQCDVLFEEGDILMLEGTRADIAQGEDRIINGPKQ